ncbi:MAG: class I SAM-dependent methyltransferase [Thermoplasmatales archaeon]
MRLYLYSGREFSIELEIGGPFMRVIETNFVKDGESIVIIPTGNWLHELAIYPYVRLGETVMKATVSTDTRYIEMFKEKYGLEHFSRYFSKARESIVLTPCGSEPGYNYDHLGKIFDIANENYISAVKENWVQLYMRRETLRLLKRYANKGDRILDLGCGPMSEVLSLGDDFLITEVDVSERALSEARKTGRSNVNYILFRGPESISGIYDIVFSSYGFLNTEGKENVISILEKNLRPGGIFIGSFLNKFGAMDILLNFVLGRFDYCRQRISGFLPVNFSRYNLLSYPRSPSYLLDSPLLTKEERRGICLISPPYNFTRLVKILGKLRIIENLDRVLSGLPLVWAISDYILFAYRKSI